MTRTQSSSSARLRFGFTRTSQDNMASYERESRDVPATRKQQQPAHERGQHGSLNHSGAHVYIKVTLQPTGCKTMVLRSTVYHIVGYHISHGGLHNIHSLSKLTAS